MGWGGSWPCSRCCDPWRDGGRPLPWRPCRGCPRCASSTSRCPMGKINLKGVIIGGLVAGVVLNIIDFVLFTVILKNEMAAMMQAMGKPATMATGTIAWFTFVDFLFGIFLV